MTSEGDKWTNVDDTVTIGDLGPEWYELPYRKFYGIWSTESDYPHWIGLWPNEGLFTEHLSIARGCLRALRGAIARLRDGDTLQVYEIGEDGMPAGDPL